MSIRFADAPHTLVVAFVRIGGESRPWGIAFGHPADRPRIVTVPEGRDRDLVSEMAARFAPTLLSHLRSPALVDPPPREWRELAPLRQLWLPNASHLDMLHHLAYAYTFTRAGGDLQAALNALGRTAGWLFRDSQRAGSQHVVVAARALKEAFAFPSEDARQGHLGYLLAWLHDISDPDLRREAVAAAERLSIATTLDPTVEREVLQPLVEAWRSAREDAAARTKLATRIDDALRPELERRFDLTVEAWRHLREDPRRENAFVDTLVASALEQQWFDWARVEAAFARGEQPFVASVETDRDPRAAATAFQTAAGAAEIVEASLLHDDRELLAEAIAKGDAFVGEIEGVADEGIGRATLPVWSVIERSGGPLRVREGSSVCVVGLPKRTAQVRSIRSDGAGARTFELVLTNLKKAVRGGIGQLAVAPNDAAWIGQRVAFAGAANSLSFAKNRKLWARDVPGSWLTLSRPGPERAWSPDDEMDEAI
jgi:hypothetical protein